MRRFYLFNSPMTYDPQTISRAIMFIANKSENHLLTAKNYAEKIPKVTAEMVLAPEFTIVQALRFNFEVRHPFRGLKGGHLGNDGHGQRQICHCVEPRKECAGIAERDVESAEES